MRKDIHPDFVECIIKCSCGNKIETRSVKAEMSIEVCSNCHPFFTGEQRFLDVAGRVEKFQKKFGDNWKKNLKEKKVAVKTETKKTDAESTEVKPEAKVAQTPKSE